jgi:hypothetical protein
MKIIQAKGIVKDGEVKVTLNEEFSNGEVDVIIVAKNDLDEFEERHQLMIEKGYDSPEKVLELIRQVKLEMLQEKGRSL